MSKRKFNVRAECPQCTCGDVSFLGPEKLREKFIGSAAKVECGGGRNATAAKSLKIPVAETPK